MKCGVSCETYHCRSLKIMSTFTSVSDSSRMRIFWNKQCGKMINIVKGREWKRNPDKIASATMAYDKNRC